MRAAALLAAVAAAAVGAAAASAAPPTVFHVAFDDPVIEADFAAFLSATCGAPVDVALDGKVVVHEFAGPSRLVEIDSYSLRLTATNTATGASIVIRDAGPDVVAFDRTTGHLTIAITGRSTTGSGVIGRVVVDLDTGEVLSQAGNERGFFGEIVCAAIT